ncbi:MAG TPA: hypothetical protein VFO39_08610 [Candidatus Sulfotelmatobacter sp.]|nr:hypothetical protein [Candidatus Sulfotelmatobacter sp.]
MEEVVGSIPTRSTKFLIAGTLYGISPVDGAIYGAVFALILLVATLASLLSAWREGSVEPSEVLREQ